MLNILFDLCKSGEYASFYTDYRETDKFHYGKVLDVNDREIAICMISPDGEEDGVTVMSSENVFRVECNGQYSEKMRKMCFGKALFSEKIETDNKNIMLSLLQLSAKNKEIVSIELLDSGFNDIIGFVDTPKNGECVIRQIDEYGFEDVFSSVLIENITKLTLDSQDEKRIMFLQKTNNQY